MTHAMRATSKQWGVRQASLLFAACLLAGIAAGYLLHWWKGTPGFANTAGTSTTATQTPAGTPISAGGADGSVKTLLAQIAADPKNPDLLTHVGDVYYDQQQYAQAVRYYAQALTIRPGDAAVRTDMGTADWYLGHADEALAQYDQAGALADWNHLMQVHPDYEQREKVQQMIADLERKKGAKGP
jgi:tetratricopeptide (TPR) repeat protein